MTRKHTTRRLNHSLVALALVAASSAALMSACADTDTCQKFADHLADVVAKEAGDKQVSAENRDKMIKNTFETCVAEKPKKEQLECAIKADSTEAMKACEKSEEAPEAKK